MVEAARGRVGATIRAGESLDQVVSSKPTKDFDVGLAGRSDYAQSFSSRCSIRIWPEDHVKGLPTRHVVKLLERSNFSRFVYPVQSSGPVLSTFNPRACRNGVALCTGTSQERPASRLKGSGGGGRNGFALKPIFAVRPWNCRGNKYFRAS
jgi:hypothetical protein